MKLLAPITTLLYSASVLAQDTRPPDNCDTEDKSRRGADFVLREHEYDPKVPALRAIFAGEGRLVSVADVFNDGNRQMTADATIESTWRWQSGDVDTETWVPQGISTTADALDVGTYEGYDGFIVSWYTNTDGKASSARVSLVNKETLKYRHILLVYPHAEDDFREVPIHAGGVMWYGNTLWVVDTDNGIRVFDMDNIWHVDQGDAVGKNGNGGYSARGYKYVVPQVMWYEWTGDFPFKFSYISLDRTTTPDSLLVGEYREDSADHPIRQVRWDLDYTMRTLKTNVDGLASATWAYCVNVDRAQGAVQVDGTIYISRSNSAVRAGEIFTWTPGGPAVKTQDVRPGPEDLTYDKRTKEVFTLSEHAGNRYIFGIKVSELQP
ncbi:uncharacterized protein DNG_04569 [Cephalotrichum gorgonifer]|uniref:Secreted protein n=1 Tax=Cephalotrichum gorgonifer TaxID=2041049 RepID=A0AAE8MWC3_9PEZI|nr:uncharacterized protein DNG_04569 [Cephalotrichum gorgonifer]